MAGSGKDHCGSIMLGQVLVSGIDIWFVSVGMGHARFEVVWDQDLGDASKKMEGMNMGSDPGG
jgi:hypothetical protein